MPNIWTLLIYDWPSKRFIPTYSKKSYSYFIGLFALFSWINILDTRSIYLRSKIVFREYIMNICLFCLVPLPDFFSV